MNKNDKTLEQARMLEAILKLPKKEGSKEVLPAEVKKFFSEHLEIVVIK